MRYPLLLAWTSGRALTPTRVSGLRDRSEVAGVALSKRPTRSELYDLAHAMPEMSRL